MSKYAPAMVKKLSAVVVSLFLMGACGGGNTPADGPDDKDGGDGTTETDGDGATKDGDGDGAAKDGDGKTKDGPEPGGIVRDADGDGVPDDKQKGGCEGKNETQCKINMACAWSTEGKCVKGGGGM